MEDFGRESLGRGRRKRGLGPSDEAVRNPRFEFRVVSPEILKVESNECLMET